MSGFKPRIVTSSSEELMEMPEGNCILVKKDSRAPIDNRNLSKFGGLPYITESIGWPVCASCRNHLSFVAQLRSFDARKFFPGDLKMLLFFYCFSCMPFWNVDKKGFWIGWIDVNPENKLLKAKHTPLIKGPKESLIKFKASIDFPEVQDVNKFDDLTSAQKSDLTKRFPVQKSSKIGGFPAWQQKSDYPKCLDCGASMNFIGQIASDEFHGFNWAGNSRVLILNVVKNARIILFQLFFKANEIS